MKEAFADTTYADPAQLAEWLRTAAPGQQAIYARGCALNPENATVKLVAQWREARDVLTVQRRVNGVLNYVAQRRAQADLAAPAPKGKSGARALPPENAAEAVLLAYIEGLAEDGLPLPTNSAIAEVLGRDCRDLRDRDQVRYRLRQLQAAGFVQVADVEGETLTAGGSQAFGRARRATICATGAQTAGLIGANPAGRERAA
jgi:hypothetical protein